MAGHKKTFLEKLQYIFAPGDSKGVGFFDRLVITTALGAQDAWVASPNDPKEKMVLDAVASLAPKMGIAHPPKIIIYKSDRPNAASIVTGNIVVGTNLMDIMTPGQIEAVLGHELAHHRHRSRDLPVVLGVPVVYDVGMEMARPVLMRNASPNQKLAFATVEAVGWGATNILAPLAYMRSLEYEADKEGATYSGRPEDMIGALEALEKRIKEIRQKQYPNKQFSDKPSSWMNFLKTHPPTASRIEKLKLMGHAQEPDSHQLSSASSGEVSR